MMKIFSVLSGLVFVGALVFLVVNVLEYDKNANYWGSDAYDDVFWLHPQNSHLQAIRKQRIISDVYFYDIAYSEGDAEDQGVSFSFKSFSTDESWDMTDADVSSDAIITDAYDPEDPEGSIIYSDSEFLNEVLLYNYVSNSVVTLEADLTSDEYQISRVVIIDKESYE